MSDGPNKPGENCSECCGDGVIESSEDCYSYRSGHYTRDASWTCERCDGDGIEPEHDDDCDCEFCIEVDGE